MVLNRPGQPLQLSGPANGQGRPPSGTRPDDSEGQAYARSPGAELAEASDQPPRHLLDANQALERLRTGQFNGAIVLTP